MLARLVAGEISSEEFLDRAKSHGSSWCTWIMDSLRHYPNGALQAADIFRNYLEPKMKVRESWKILCVFLLVETETPFHQAHEFLKAHRGYDLYRKDFYHCCTRCHDVAAPRFCLEDAKGRDMNYLDVYSDLGYCESTILRILDPIVNLFQKRRILHLQWLVDQDIDLDIWRWLVVNHRYLNDAEWDWFLGRMKSLPDLPQMIYQKMTLDKYLTIQRIFPSTEIDDNLAISMGACDLVLHLWNLGVHADPDHLVTVFVEEHPQVSSWEKILPWMRDSPDRVTLWQKLLPLTQEPTLWCQRFRGEFPDDFARWGENIRWKSRSKAALLASGAVDLVSKLAGNDDWHTILVFSAEMGYLVMVELALQHLPDLAITMHKKEGFTRINPHAMVEHPRIMQALLRRDLLKTEHLQEILFICASECVNHISLQDTFAHIQKCLDVTLREIIGDEENLKKIVNGCFQSDNHKALQWLRSQMEETHGAICEKTAHFVACGSSSSNTKLLAWLVKEGYLESMTATKIAINQQLCPNYGWEYGMEYGKDYGDLFRVLDDQSKTALEHFLKNDIMTSLDLLLSLIPYLSDGFLMFLTWELAGNDQAAKPPLLSAHLTALTEEISARQLIIGKLIVVGGSVILVRNNHSPDILPGARSIPSGQLPKHLRTYSIFQLSRESDADARANCLAALEKYQPFTKRAKSAR